MSRNSLSTVVLALAVALVATLTSVHVARADVYVIESTASSIRPGTSLAANETVNIPAGSYIRAVLPTGKTRTIKGPYNGTVADMSQGGQNEGVMAWLRTLLQTGGAMDTTPGATRSFGLRTSTVPTGFSWTDVPVGVDGGICIQRDANLQVARAPSQRADRATLVDLASGTQAQIQWTPGSGATAWPANITPKAEGTYQLVMADRPRRQITLHIIDRLPGDDDVLTELQGKGCRHQFEAYVREKMAPAKRNPS